MPKWTMADRCFVFLEKPLSVTPERLLLTQRSEKRKALLSVSDKNYSLSRAIASVLTRGSAVGIELEYHLEEQRKREQLPAHATMFNAVSAGGHVLHVPLTAFRAVGVGTSGGASLVGRKLERVSDLLSSSACVQAGARMLKGLRENVGLARTNKLPEPQWVAELGFSPSTDPEFSMVQLGPPKRVSGLVVVSKMLLLSASPGLDQFLADDLSWACSRLLDRFCLYGPDGNTDAPTGILGTTGIHTYTVDWVAVTWTDFIEMQRLIENEDIAVDSFAYITSLNAKAFLSSQPRWFGLWAAADTAWERPLNPISTMAVRDYRVFFGAFNQMAIGIWGDSADIVINPYSRAGNGQVEIVCNLFCSVAIRMPRAFGVGAPTNPPPFRTAPPAPEITPLAQPPLPQAPQPQPLPIPPQQQQPPSASAEARGSKKGPFR